MLALADLSVRLQMGRRPDKVWAHARTRDDWRGRAAGIHKNARPSALWHREAGMGASTDDVERRALREGVDQASDCGEEG